MYSAYSDDDDDDDEKGIFFTQFFIILNSQSKHTEYPMMPHYI